MGYYYIAIEPYPDTKRLINKMRSDIYNLHPIPPLYERVIKVDEDTNEVDFFGLFKSKKYKRRVYMTNYEEPYYFKIIDYGIHKEKYNSTHKTISMAFELYKKYKKELHTLMTIHKGEW